MSIYRCFAFDKHLKFARFRNARDKAHDKRFSNYVCTRPLPQSLNA